MNLLPLLELGTPLLLPQTSAWFPGLQLNHPAGSLGLQLADWTSWGSLASTIMPDDSYNKHPLLPRPLLWSLLVY